MTTAADCAEVLNQELRDCERRMRKIDTDLQAAGFQGKTAVAFSTYVTTVGAPALISTADMLAQTSIAIKHTRDQFQTADDTLSTTFTG